MYAFCVAVVLSLTVGILIEHLAERVKGKEARREKEAKTALIAGRVTAVGAPRSAAAAAWRAGQQRAERASRTTGEISPAICEGAPALSPLPEPGGAGADAEPLSPSLLSPSVAPLISHSVDARHLETDVSGATLLAAEGQGSERSCSRPSADGGGGEGGGGGSEAEPYPTRGGGSARVLARRWWRAWRAWLRGVPGEREWCLGVELCGRRGAVHAAHVLPNPNPNPNPDPTPTPAPASTPTPTPTPYPTPTPTPNPNQARRRACRPGPPRAGAAVRHDRRLLHDDLPSAVPRRTGARPQGQRNRLRRCVQHGLAPTSTPTPTQPQTQTQTPTLTLTPS